MSYRFVKITSIYPGFIQEYYKRFPDVVNLCYKDQLNHLMRREFFWSDHHSVHLRKLGVDAYEIVSNALPMQKRWAIERGFNETDENAILLSQLQSIKPDVVFLFDAFSFKGDWIQRMRLAVPSIRQVIGWCCAPFSNDHLKTFITFDYMLTCTPGFVAHLDRYCIKAYQMNHAFEPRILSKVYYNNPMAEADLVFFGSLMAGNGYHNGRRAVLDEIINKGLEVKVFGHVPHQSQSKLWLKRIAYPIVKSCSGMGLTPVLSKIPRVNRYLSQLEHFPKSQRLSRKLSSKVHPPLYGLEMFQALSKGKIGLNAHIDCSGIFAGNIRLFEVTGVGSCLLTDWKANLHELFSPDSEVVAYRSAQDCIEKAKWLIDHPKERMEIAEAGHKRCLSDHTFSKRAEQLHDIILDNLS